MDSSLSQKYLGGMIGSALGDAIGELAFRYPTREVLSAQIDFQENLIYTDDTAMAIGLAQSLKRTGKIDQKDLGDTFRTNFYQEPWRGYASGPPTVFSLVQELGISYQEAARRLFNGSGSFGNGGAMRIAPLALFFHDSPELYEYACESAQVTHAHPVGTDGAALLALAIAQAVRQDPNKPFRHRDFTAMLVDNARTIEMQKKIKLVEKLLQDKTGPDQAAQELGRTVAVQESMPFALFSFFRFPQSYEECLFCAILHGGDRDTLGAMAGALSGACLGIARIPPGWRQKLENHNRISELALALAGTPDRSLNCP
jgi:poly(ADP-ribose) glycohydrolase ARH3